MDASQSPKGSGSAFFMLALLILLVGYPLSEGPAAYSLGRGWMSIEAYEAAYAPLDALVPHKMGRIVEWYPVACYVLGERHQHAATGRSAFGP